MARYNEKFLILNNQLSVIFSKFLAHMAKPFPNSHDLFHLLIGSILISVNIVCFHETILSEVHLIYAAYVKSRQKFQDKIRSGIGT